MLSAKVLVVWLLCTTAASLFVRPEANASLHLQSSTYRESSKFKHEMFDFVNRSLMLLAETTDTNFLKVRVDMEMLVDNQKQLGNAVEKLGLLLAETHSAMARLEDRVHALEMQVVFL